MTTLTSNRNLGLRSRFTATIAAAATLLATTTPARADINDVLDRIMDRTTQARDRAAEAKAGVTEVRSRITAGAANLTDEVRTAIAAAMTQVRDNISVEAAGMAEFERQNCATFRARLVRFLTDLQAIEQRLDATLSSCGLESPLDGGRLQALLDAVESMDCSLLYPLYAVNIDFCAVDDLHETVDALEMLRNLLADSPDGGADDADGGFEPPAGSDDDEDPAAVDRALFAKRLSDSRMYIQHHKAFSKAAARVKRTGKVLAKISSLLEAQGEAGTEATIGVHGYALLTVKFNKTKQLAIGLKSTSGFLDKLAADVESKLKDAETVSATNLLLSNQEAILRNQEALLQAR